MKYCIHLIYCFSLLPVSMKVGFLSVLFPVKSPAPKRGWHIVYTHWIFIELTHERMTAFKHRVCYLLAGCVPNLRSILLGHLAHPCSVTSLRELQCWQATSLFIFFTCHFSETSHPFLRKEKHLCSKYGFQSGSLKNTLAEFVCGNRVGSAMPRLPPLSQARLLRR